MNDHPNILITGGADGLGEALAKAHRSQGDEVTILDIDVQRGKALAKEIGVRFVSCNLAAFDGDTLEIGEQAFDVIYLNAGISAFGNFAEIGWEKQTAVLEINMLGHMKLLRQLLAKDHVANGARLAFVLSAAAFTPVPVTATYSASKAGLEGFARAIEPWLMHRKISISRIYPGQM
ncbi:MAG: SDR family NAD(P)-dependent oxidoreductase, partial [Verrucomicrobiota bacterium]